MAHCAVLTAIKANGVQFNKGHLQMKYSKASLLDTDSNDTLSPSLSQAYSLKDYKQLKSDIHLRGLGPDYTAAEQTVSISRGSFTSFSNISYSHHIKKSLGGFYRRYISDI